MDEPVCLHVGDIQLTGWMEQFNNETVSVRYWVSSESLTVEKAVQLDAETLLGVIHADISHFGTEVTGYMYTTETAVIGGHDLVQVLTPFAKEEKYYLLIEVVVHKHPF